MIRFFLGTFLTLSLFASNIEASPAAAARAAWRAVRIGLESGAVGLLYFPKRYCDSHKKIGELEGLDTVIPLATANIEARLRDLGECDDEDSIFEAKQNLKLIKHAAMSVEQCKGVLSKLGEDPDKVKIVGFQRNILRDPVGASAKTFGRKTLLFPCGIMETKDDLTFLFGHEASHLSQPLHAFRGFGVPAICAPVLIKRALSKPMATTNLRFLGRILFKSCIGYAFGFLVLVPISWYYEWRADMRSANVLGCAEGGVEFFKHEIDKARLLRDRFYFFTERTRSGEMTSEDSQDHFTKAVAASMIRFLITEKGNARFDILHPPVTWRLKQMQKLSREQAQQKVEAELRERARVDK